MIESNVRAACKAAKIIMGYHYPIPSPPGDEETSTKEKQSYADAVNTINLDTKTPGPPKHKRIPAMFQPANNNPPSPKEENLRQNQQTKNKCHSKMTQDTSNADLILT
jgi:hypothetical protein